ncbi:MAG: FAD-dependent monooxygenase, partial [bacterium]
MTALSGTRALVIGAGRSGRAAASLLAARGARVRVVERNPAARRDPAWPAAVELVSGESRPVSLDGIGLVVPSPGVPHDHPLLTAAV